MFVREPMPQDVSERFTEVAMGTRLSWHMVSNCGDPAQGSTFLAANELYPFEKVSDRARHYVGAALEHLLMWADHAAPLKFHPDQQVNFTMRPSYALARASLETAAQAVWLLDTRDPRECIRRHLCLIRLDLDEHRKSRSDPEEKAAIRAQDEALLERVEEAFAPKDLHPPGYLQVVIAAASADDLDLDPANAEWLYRAASGAAHGMYWPNIALKKVEPGEQYEPGHYRTRSLPDPELMAQAIRGAFDMTSHAAGKYLMWSGVDVPALAGGARRWLAENVTLRDDHDPEVLMKLRD